jgi:thiamine kinase-like enzyme
MPITGTLNHITQIMPNSFKHYDKYQFIHSRFFNPPIPNGTKLIFQHGDFCAWNILFHENKLNLIDFEESTTLGLPLFDYIYFKARYCQLFSRKDYILLLIEECRDLLHSLDHLEKHILLVQSYMIYISLEKHDIDFAIFINNIRFILK